MRYREFKLTEEQLDELKMSPSSLGAFAKSPLAQGIQAGFEAELIFRDVANDSDREYGPDFDQDTTIDSIDELREFFSENNSYRQVNELISNIENDGWFDYYQEQQDEWIRDSMEDRLDLMFDDWFADNAEDLIREILAEDGGYNEREIGSIIKAGTRQYDEKDWDSPETYDQMSDLYSEYKVNAAEKARPEFDNDHEDEVRDELEQEFDGDEVDFGAFLRNRFGNRYASTIWEEYQGTVDWPYYNYDDEEGGEYNEDAAEDIARELSRELGMQVVSSGGYHSTKRRPNVWIIEPDSSLEPDNSSDMGAELVSPPMPLNVCLEKMETLFNWVESSENAYANESTGFHMGVSLPITQGNVDFVKLALFLGDEHVLQEFGRSSNTYAVAAIKKIRDRIKTGNAKVADAMQLMQRGLIELANRSIMGSRNDGFGKYTSINPKGAYIEFRSAGGTDYIEDFKKAKNTLLRYSQAMVVAADPQAERQEYYKKLYKLISPATGNSSLDLFARFAAGTISKEDLKNQWATSALSSAETPGPDTDPKPNRRVELAKRIKGPTPPNYYIRNIETGEFVYLYTAQDNEEAVKLLNKYSSIHPGKFQYGQTRFLKPDELAQAKKNTEADTVMQQPAQQQSEPRHAQQARSSNGVPMWEIYNRVTGLGLHQFADHTQTSAWQTAHTWAQEQGFANRMDVLSVRPVMPQD